MFFILLNIVYGSYETPFHNRKPAPLFKQRLPDYDNRYVWFTRDIHDEIQQGETNQEQFHNIFFHKKK